MFMTSTGTKIEVVRATPASFNQAGFEALTFTQANGLTGVGAFGASAALVENNQIDEATVGKYKGLVNWGSVALDFSYDPDDAGQAIIELGVEDISTGGAAYDNHSFKLTYQSGAVRYLYGMIMSAPENPGSANSMISRSVNIELQAKPVRVAAP